VGSLPGLLSRSAAADGTGNRGEGTGVLRILIHSVQGLTGRAPENSCASVDRRTSSRVLRVSGAAAGSDLCASARGPCVSQRAPYGMCPAHAGRHRSRTLPEGAHSRMELAQMPVAADRSASPGPTAGGNPPRGRDRIAPLQQSHNRTKHIEIVSVGSPAAILDYSNTTHQHLIDVRHPYSHHATHSSSLGCRKKP